MPQKKIPVRLSNGKRVVMRRFLLCLLGVLSTIASTSYAGDSIRVAVAANFRAPLQQLIKDYREVHPQQVIQFSSASSGTLYQQVLHGAPFNIFLSADRRYPEQLEKNNIISAKGRHTYALGELVLWVPKQSWNSLQALTPALSKKLTLAIANPKTAPYGRAAEKLITALSLHPKKIVRGHSIAQTHQFIASGNVDGGFVARSQVLNQKNVISVDVNLYAPIEQQMALLKPSNSSARQFYQYLLSPRAQKIIQKLGYRSPEDLHLATD